MLMLMPTRSQSQAPPAHLHRQDLEDPLQQKVSHQYTNEMSELNLPGSGLGLSAGVIFPPPFFSQPTTHFSKSHRPPKQPLRGPTFLQSGPLQLRSNFHPGSFTPPQKTRHRRGFGGTGNLGGPPPGGPPGGGVGRGTGIGIGMICPDEVVCVVNVITEPWPSVVVCKGSGVFGSVVPGGCAISGPSDGPGSSAIGHAEVFVAGAKTSDNGRKLCSPGSQQGPKS